MLASLAMLDPPVHLCQALELFVGHAQSTEGGQAIDRLLCMVLSVDACDHVGAVCCAL